MAAGDHLTMWERMITKDRLGIDDEVPAGQPDTEISPVDAEASGSSNMIHIAETHDTEDVPAGTRVAVVNIAETREADVVLAETRVAVVNPAVKHAHTSLPPLSLQSEMWCDLCHRKVDPIAKGTKRTGKQKEPKYQCGPCGVKLTTGNRVCGQWPTEEFRLLPVDTQVAFYQEAGGAKEFRLKYAETLTNNHIERKKVGKHGESHPLGYWATLGYDVHGIEHNTPAEHITQHPQLGTCYRVAILTDDEEKEAFMMRTQILEKLGRRKTVKKKMQGKDDVSSDDAASESSGSGRGGKKVVANSAATRAKAKKKAADIAKQKKDEAKKATEVAKEAGHAKKRAEKEQSEQEKKVKKLRREALDVACRTVAKLQGPTQELQALLFRDDETGVACYNPQLARVPRLIVEKANAVQTTARNMVAVAKESMSGGPDTRLFFSKIDEVRAVATNVAEVLEELKPFEAILQA